MKNFIKIAAVWLFLASPALAQQYQTRAIAVLTPTPHYCSIGGQPSQISVGEGVFYLPPDAPQVLPGTTLILGGGISVERGWPPNMIDPISPTFLAVDHRSKWLRCSHYPGDQDCPALVSPVVGSQFSSMTTIALLEQNSRQMQTIMMFSPSAPVTYQPGDALIFDRICEVVPDAVGTASVSGNVMTVTTVQSGAFAVGQVVQHWHNSIQPGLIPQGTEITGQASGPTGGAGAYTLSASATMSSAAVKAAMTKPIHTYATVFVADHLYSKETACSSDVKLLLHPKKFIDPATGTSLNSFVSDASPSHNPIASTVTIQKTGPLLPGLGNHSIRFNGSARVYANATIDQVVGDQPWKFGVVWRPDDVAANFQQLFALTDGYGPFVIGQLGTQFTFNGSSNGTSWNMPPPVYFGTAVAGQATYIQAQRVDDNVLLSQDGVLKATIPVSGAFFTPDHKTISIGNNATANYPARGNMQQLMFKHGSDGSFAVPTAPHPCP